MKVIKVLKTRYEFSKAQQRDGVRKEKLESSFNYTSENPYIIGNTLYTSKKLLRDINLKSSDILLIQDLPNRLELEENKAVRKDIFEFNNPKLTIIKSSKKPISFEIFKLLELENTFNISLNYTGSDVFIGFPKRDDHMIGILKQDLKLCYKINGKIEASASSRKERTYVEHEYIFEYMGEVENVSIVNSTIKEYSYPPKIHKLIDERKILY